MKEEKNKNLELYEKLKTVPETAKKSFSNGRFSGTDINSMWRIKKLTEEFGPCGIGWHTKILNMWIEKGKDDELVANVKINLYYKKDGEWSKPVVGIGGNKLATFEKNKQAIYVSDECYKMAYTDAIGSACKMIGMGADVYWNEDRTKYSKEEEQTDKKITQGQLGVLKKVYVGENLTKLLENNGLDDLEDMTIEKASELISKLKKEGN